MEWHIALSVGKFKESKKFYKTLLPYLGLKLVFDGKDSFYHVGARTALMIQKCNKKYINKNFDQGSVGLHHLCFRARSKKAVNLIAKNLIEMKAFIDRGPIQGPWVKGYYYIVFEDPNGIRLEVNFVPGSGVLEKNTSFKPTNYK